MLRNFERAGASLIRDRRESNGPRSPGARPITRAERSVRCGAGGSETLARRRGEPVASEFVDFGRWGEGSHVVQRGFFLSRKLTTVAETLCEAKPGSVVRLSSGDLLSRFARSARTRDGAE